MAKMVTITHPDGRAYAVLPADFKHGIEDEYKGFQIVAYEDGSEFAGPKTAAALRKAADPPSKTEKAVDAPKGDAAQGGEER